MTPTPSSEIQRLSLVLLAGLLPGLLFGYPGWGLSIALAGYLGWHLRQLFQLHRWLNQEQPTDPPASHGLWGETFDDIYRLQQHQLKYRAQLKRVIKRFRDSTYALKDGFIMLDSQGNIVWWNLAASRLLGLRKTDTEQPIFNLIRHPDFKAYIRTGKFEQPLNLVSPINPGTQLEYQLTRYGKQDVLLVVRDISELARLERIRTDFVANVSHELRTPLTVIDGYIETLADNLNDLHPALNKALEQMQQQSKRMNLLINDLLMLSRLESKTTAQKPVDPATIVQQACRDLEQALAEKSQRLETRIETHDLLLGNDEQLYSLVTNLLTNASKYSPPNTLIQVELRKEGEGIMLSVSDQGIGIAAQHIPRLTERFYRVDAGRSQQIKGTGLGLAIVKHILIHHDGKLSIESKLGKGSRFNCYFPGHRLQARPLVSNS